MSNRLKFKVNTTKLMRRMQRDNLDVLQNIEFYIQRAWRGNPAVDDAAVREALAAHLNWREPADGPAQEVSAALAAAREFRQDVDEEVWRDGLRVVLASVKNHSTFQPGETEYLEFVAMFVR